MHSYWMAEITWSNIIAHNVNFCIRVTLLVAFYITHVSITTQKYHRSDGWKQLYDSVHIVSNTYLREHLDGTEKSSLTSIQIHGTKGKRQNVDPRSADYLRGPGPWTALVDHSRGPLSWTSRKIFPITDHRVKQYEAEICISQQPQSFQERHISLFIVVIYFIIILVCIGVQWKIVMNANSVKGLKVWIERGRNKLILPNYLNFNVKNFETVELVRTVTTASVEVHIHVFVF